MLLRPFDYRNPEELVYFHARGSATEGERMGFSGGMVQRLRAAESGFSDIAAATEIQQNLTGVPVPEQVEVAWVTQNLFALLGVEPAVGRRFSVDDPEGLVMLSYRTWQRTFSGDPDAVGRGVELDGIPYTIVGVLPADFQLHISPQPYEIDFWKLPDNHWPNGDLWNALGPEFGLLSVVGRLAPGTPIEQAQQQIDAFAEGIRTEHPGYGEIGYEIWLRPLRERVVSEVRPTLLMLLGAVGFVLLIVCANVANLLLVRAGRRAREVSLRLALGCGRGRIVRLLLGESVLLALAGGAAGLALAFAGTRTLAAMRGDAIPRLAGVTVDGRVLAFTLVVSLMCPLIFGLAPALRASRHALSSALRDVRSSAGRGRQRATNALVVAQIALSMILMVGAGLLAASLTRLQSVPTGIETNDLLTFSISLPGTRYEWPQETGRFYSEFEERLETLPGAQSAGVIWPMPLSGSNWSGSYDGGSVEPQQNHQARYVLATPGALETVGIAVADGRTFEASDSEYVVMVSRNVAERAWAGGSAIGRTLRANPWGRGLEEFEVIGVVGNARYGGLREPADETVYFDARSWSWVDWEVDVVVRADGAPLGLVPSIQQQVAAMDAELPIAEVRLMTAYVDDNLAESRFALSVVGLFAAVAVALALIGLAGVLSFAVIERTREIGIRVAMGSTSRGILRMVVGSGLRLTIVGLTLGMLGAAALTRFLSGFLYGVTATDPLTFASVCGGVLLLGAIASYVPARRATRLNVLAALADGRR